MGSPESLDQSRVSISKSDDSVSTFSAAIPAERLGSYEEDNSRKDGNKEGTNELAAARLTSNALEISA